MRVKDIGIAVDGPENAKLAGWQNGKRGIQLLIFKQPGANVIDTVNKIRAELPRLQAAIPPSVHVDTVIDRTLTIQASVKDVQFTLLLSIALVVMVNLPFPAQFLGDGDPQRHCAAGTGWYVRGHVPAGLQP